MIINSIKYRCEACSKNWRVEYHEDMEEIDLNASILCRDCKRGYKFAISKIIERLEQAERILDSAKGQHHLQLYHDEINNIIKEFQ